MFVDVYAIQTIPPSNINRDDTGNPKTARYGNVLRARVSSQAWKRAMRIKFRESLAQQMLGVRTKYAFELVLDQLLRDRPELDSSAAKFVESVMKHTGIVFEKSSRKGKDHGRIASKYLVFISRSEIVALAQLAAQLHDGNIQAKELEDAVKEAFSGKDAIDVALFGRMLADAPSLNVDASSQVAHAISVDATQTEYDYFTAIDDEATDDNKGASMIDTVGFNSSTLYRYACVNVTSLQEQLGNVEVSAKAVCTFVDAFARAMPTGKQNTFANRTLPQTLLVVMRDHQTINAVDAFEVPIRHDDDHSVSEKATQALVKRLEEIHYMYDEHPETAWCVSMFKEASHSDFATTVTLSELTQQLADYIRSSLSGVN